MFMARLTAMMLVFEVMVVKIRLRLTELQLIPAILVFIRMAAQVDRLSIL